MEWHASRASCQRRVEAGMVLRLSVFLVLVVMGCGGAAQGFGRAEDVQREIDLARAATPLPPGRSFSSIELDPGGMYEAGSGTNMIQFQAACAWFDYWSSAIGSGDQQAQMQSRAMASRIRTWRVYTTADRSLRDDWDAMIEDAHLGDATRLNAMVDNNCD